MSVPAASPAPASAPMTREHLSASLERLMPGPKLSGARKRILSWADAYAAHLIEEHARPDERWGPK